MIRRLILAVALALPGLALAQRAPALPDEPALARPGDYAVGVRSEVLVEPDAADLVSQPGKVGHGPRRLPLTIWYPALAGAKAPRAHYVPQTWGPQASGGYTGAAMPGVAPVRGQHFPLVVFSHGYRNWATGFSDLAEHLASRGYVVAAIDHHDAEPSPKMPRLVSFAMTVATRTQDQRFVIDRLAHPAGVLAGVYDPQAIALIGYSMGGFGALATAGAGYDPAGALMARMPAGLMAPWLDRPGGVGTPEGLRAVVAFAPWGGEMPLRAWSGAGLAGIRVPLLMVAGDHDDVSGYATGIHWLFDQAVHADRRLLVFQNAHHNIVGDGVAGIAHPGFEWVERLEEPVWRRDRILAVNRHFVTAFLDSVFRPASGHGRYLDVPVAEAAQGTWPLEQGQSVGDRLASADDPQSRGYWPGFQRRWALGLELHHAAPAP